MADETTEKSTCMKIKPKNKERLDKIGNKGDTYDDVINRLLDHFEKKHPIK